jgi:2-oxoglutarate ferredoxin oxidoreductase subunit beta
MKMIDESHDPYDKQAALALAQQWGDEIPIGILYKSDRPSLESQLEVLKNGALVEQFQAARMA